MTMITFLGLAAGACTTFSFLPQLLKIWKTRSTGDISVGMYVTLSTGLVLWVIYGILIASWPIIISNSVALMFSCALLALKMRLG